MGIVYFLQDGGAVKIGYTTDVVGRRRDLQTGNPRKLQMLVSIPGVGPRAERYLHHRLAKHRISGEWFDLNGVLEYLSLELGAKAEIKMQDEWESADIEVDKKPQDDDPRRVIRAKAKARKLEKRRHVEDR